MERRTVTYVSELDEFGRMYWYPQNYNYGGTTIRIHDRKYYAYDYPTGTTLTITVAIQTPDAGKLDDEAARGLNEYMNGEG